MIRLSDDKVIGDFRPKKPFIIAEVGSNWQNLDDCLLSINEAANADADAVKFQIFSNEALYGIKKESNPYSLPIEWLDRLKYECQKFNVEFMCTAFSTELYKIVDPFVNIHKVASAEMSHIRILETLKELGKPIILSTGGRSTPDIKMALQVLDKAEVILTYCVASYPAKEINLENIPHFMYDFGGYRLVGYSDHSIDVLNIPKLAVEKGACLIEKHFKLKDMNTPDNGHSLNPKEFKKMVQSLRGVDQPIGIYTEEENPMAMQHNRRLIAIKDILPGEVLEENVNFGIYRSLKVDTKGMSPFAAGYINNKKSTVSISKGDGIGPLDFE